MAEAKRLIIEYNPYDEKTHSQEDPYLVVFLPVRDESEFTLRQSFQHYNHLHYYYGDKLIKVIGEDSSRLQSGSLTRALAEEYGLFILRNLDRHCRKAGRINNFVYNLPSNSIFNVWDSDVKVFPCTPIRYVHADTKRYPGIGYAQEVTDEYGFIQIVQFLLPPNGARTIQKANQCEMLWWVEGGPFYSLHKLQTPPSLGTGTWFNPRWIEYMGGMSVRMIIEDLATGVEAHIRENADGELSGMRPGLLLNEVAEYNDTNPTAFSHTQQRGRWGESATGSAIIF